MRVVVTQIAREGALRRSMVDTAASADAGLWEQLAERALLYPPPYRAAPEGLVYHLRVDDRTLLVAEHDLGGALQDLVTAVLAVGEPLLPDAASGYLS
jgi:hypothetical protein